MAFLEILTRAYKRPNMLSINTRALAEQTDRDYVQTILPDEVGMGIAVSYERLAAYAPQLVGEYVWILDDDDVCIRPSLIAELKAICKAHDPDVIMLRMDHGPRGILPGADTWETRPQMAGLGVSAFVVRQTVWKSCAQAFLPGSYASDFDFIAAIFDSGASVHWHDVIASRVQMIGLGKPENG